MISVPAFPSTSNILRGLFQEIKLFRATLDDLVTIYLKFQESTKEILYTGNAEDVRRALLDDLGQLCLAERLVLDAFNHYHLPLRTTKPPTSRTSEMILMTGVFAELVKIGQAHQAAKSA